MTTPDFALNDAVLLRSGERGTIVALPADVKAAGGPPGSYRVKLDNPARGWEYALRQLQAASGEKHLQELRFLVHKSKRAAGPTAPSDPS